MSFHINQHEMKKIALFLAAISSILLISCNKDFSKVSVTYTKATAVYADLEEIRQMPLIGGSREITNPGKIFVSQNLLLIGEEGEGVHVIDNTDPANPQNIYFINIPGNKEFYVHDDHLYAESYYDMVKIDISTIQQPTLTSRVENAFSPNSFNAAGEPLIGFTFELVTEKLDQDEDYYQLIHQNDFNYFDFQDRLIPESAVPASFAGNSQQGIGSVNRIAYSNGHLYTISNTQLSSFSDNGSLELVSSENIGWQMETIYPYDDKLFIGTRNSMEVMGLSDPGRPVHITSFWHANACDPVYPIDDVAYLTLRAGTDDETDCPGSDNLLVVLDIKQIESPEVSQEINMASPYGMTMIGNKLYVGEGSNGLKIFDASDKLNLILESAVTSIQAYDVIAHPTKFDILLIAGPDGLSQYEIQTDNRELLSNIPF